MTGLKTEWLRLMNMTKIIGDEFPEYIAYQQRLIYNILEDVHSVASMTELQEAIDQIGVGAGTVFITAGTHIVDTPIDIDGGGSLVIYGHGDNTILQPDDGINVFNITDCASLIIKTLQIDATNYTGATSSVIVNETNDNIVVLEDVTIIGNNLGTGIELVSNNCIIEHCNISQLLDGIYVNNSNRHIIAQNILSNNARYGINLNTSLYSSINGNTSNSNLMGIYVDSSTNNSISNNICNLNTENGIYITGSSYNTISGNTCENNDSNTVNSQAGMFITTNSDFNTISGNSLNNNNNIGAGTGYGIIIALNTCNENVVAANNANGNDIDFMDSGTDTTIEYYVQDENELQDAIDSIGTKAGIINIEGSFTVNATIDIDGNGSYIIRGAGSNTTLTTVGDISCFNIDIARSVIMRNFTIDASSITTATREIIDVNEDSDNIIILDNIVITGDGTNGYGIELNSLNCRIENCTIDNINIGINILSNSNIIEGNNVNNCASYGIQVSADYNNIISNICNSNLTGIYILNGTGNSINNNTVQTNNQNGIYLNGSSYNSLNDNICDGNDSNTANPQAGIYVDNNSDNNTIIGNTSINNNNIGGGDGYGVYIGNANCNMNIVRSNNISGNDIAWNDLGTNSDFEYRCSSNAEIQNAIDSIADKAGIIILLTGNITISTTIDVDGGGDYVIEGEGMGSVLTPSGNFNCFNITNAKSGTILRNFKIDIDAYTAFATTAVYIAEGSDNKVIVDNVNIVNPTGAEFGYGVHTFNSDNCVIINCYMDNLYVGVYNTASDYLLVANNRLSAMDYAGIVNGGSNNIFSANNCASCELYGIWLGGNYNIVNGNNCSHNTALAFGIHLTSAFYNVISNNMVADNKYGISVDDSGNNNIVGNMIYLNTEFGIYLFDNSDNNHISGNFIAVNGTGVKLFGATVNSTIIGLNQFVGNATDIDDTGTDTIIHGDNTVYGAGWNGDLGTTTKNAIYDAIESIREPIGTIMMFSGAWTDNITRVGWYKCDGNNGTVNLVDKFVRGGVASGAEGGSDNAIVVTHNHSHTHTGGAHYHNSPQPQNVGDNDMWGQDDLLSAAAMVYESDNACEDNEVASRTNTKNVGTLSTDTTGAGASGVGKNIPTFYTLIFIQRIS